jgi:hypothetical protein
MAKLKDVNTAGHFILGQSKQDWLNIENDEKFKNAMSQLADSYVVANLTEKKKLTETSDSKVANNYNFDSQFSFLGRLFNFNVWDHVKSPNSILNIYLDCKLTECGNATQWSDFRQGTRGDVKFKWPTSLLWKSKIFFF